MHHETSTDKNRTHIAIVNQGVDYIVDHLLEKITVEMIADHCCFSRHYYNRLFKSITGESIYSFIRRLRIETAAFKLIKFPHLSITSIAAELGYSSSNFSVLFKGYYGLSPSRFRSNPKLPSEPASQSTIRRIQKLQKKKPVELLNKIDQRIKFKELPEIKLMYQRFRGNIADLPLAWLNFCDRVIASYSKSPLEFYGISYDDPLIVGEEKCLYDLCVKVTPAVKVRGDNYRIIQAGTYLCYYFEGTVRDIRTAYNNLFAGWMPHRGYIMGPGFCFERYRPETIAGSHIVMDLCIPIFS